MVWALHRRVLPPPLVITMATTTCVVLLTVCSLRKDHVGAFGALDIQTPHMDKVAQQGIRNPEIALGVFEIDRIDLMRHR